MNTITGGLRSRLEGFEIDEPGVSLPFSARLARENGWTLAFAGRVVREYKRFLFLTASAGHPVTPSEEVDQAWHLHMVYTRSYWDRLCGEVLGRPLHHDPTEGGAAEGMKFRDWYARTLESYRIHFGENPPGDIWPGVEKRFARAGEAQWVDRSRYWLVPRPGWLPRARKTLGSLLLMAVAVGGLFIPSCSGRRGSMPAFDGPGTSILVIYAVLYVLCLRTALRIRARSRALFETGHEPPPLTDPYEAAFLSGGGRRVMQAALARLCAAEALEVCKSRWGKVSLRPTGKVPVPLYPVEREVLDTARATGAARGTPVPELMGGAPYSLRAIEARLASLGLKPTEKDRQRASLELLAPFLLLIAAGVLVLVFTHSQEKPAAFLIIPLIITFITPAVLDFNTRKLTAAGRRMLGQLRENHRQAARPAEESPDSLLASVGLLGIGSLSSVPALGLLHAELERSSPAPGSGGGGKKRDEAGGCSGGCGSSGCGSSGCGSSGCGGGGGGCGGGGCGGS